MHPTPGATEAPISQGLTLAEHQATAPSPSGLNVHPTRSAPLCANCQHVTGDIAEGFSACNHPSQPISVVSGQALAVLRQMRDEEGACGPRGRLFVQRIGQQAD